MKNPYEDFVAERLTAGDEPDEIMSGIKDAIFVMATDWALWGDGRWRVDRVCSICGSGLPGICGHQGQDRELILWHVYMERQRTAP